MKKRIIMIFSVILICCFSSIFILKIIINEKVENEQEYENIIFNGTSWAPNSEIALIYGQEQLSNNDYQLAVYLYKDHELIKMDIPKDVLDFQILKIQWSYNSNEALITIYEPPFNGGLGYCCSYRDGIISILKNRIILGTFAWSPVSDFALISMDNHLYKYSNNSFIKVDTDEIDHTFNVIKWKPDGSQALLIAEDNSVLSYTEKKINFLNDKLPTVPNNSNWWNAVWSINDQECLIVSSMGQVCLFNQSNLIEINITPQPNVRYGSIGIAWDPNDNTALIIGSDFNTGSHGYILEYEDLNITVICQNSGLSFDKVVWSSSNYAFISASKNPTVVTRSDPADDLELNEWNSYGYIYEYKEKSLQRLDTIELWEVGDFDYNEELDCYLIGGGVFEDGSWHTRVFTYCSNTTIDFQINVNGWINHVAWSPNNEIGIIVGLLGMVFEYDGENINDLSVM